MQESAKFILTISASLLHCIMQLKQRTITANASSKTILTARRLALNEGKSLRVWAGEVIAEALSKVKAGTKPAN